MNLYFYVCVAGCVQNCNISNTPCSIPVLHYQKKSEPVLIPFLKHSHSSYPPRKKKKKITPHQKPQPNKNNKQTSKQQTKTKRKQRKTKQKPKKRRGEVFALVMLHVRSPSPSSPQSPERLRARPECTHPPNYNSPRCLTVKHCCTSVHPSYCTMVVFSDYPGFLHSSD